MPNIKELSERIRVRYSTSKPSNKFYLGDLVKYSYASGIGVVISVPNQIDDNYSVSFQRWSKESNIFFDSVHDNLLEEDLELFESAYRKMETFEVMQIKGNVEVDDYSNSIDDKRKVAWKLSESLVELNHIKIQKETFGSANGRKTFLSYVIELVVPKKTAI